MKYILVFATALCSACASSPQLKTHELSTSATPATCTASAKHTLVVHGGVGYVANEKQERLLKDVLKSGNEKLQAGAHAIDVVQETVEKFEDSGLFNTGRGGTRTSIDTVELDASIMDGRDLSAGAVASLKTIKNPIRLARYVKDHTPHVLMVSTGAEALAEKAGVERVTPDYFNSPKSKPKIEPHGTVGAVAVDRCGDLASATSTGGLHGKLPGRVGDSPLIGAGTYANNTTVAVSATGDGEKFIRASVGARISLLMEFGRRDLDTAAKESLDLVTKLNGGGGVIAVSKDHKVEMATNNSLPMPAGFVHEDGVVTVQGSR